MWGQPGLCSSTLCGRGRAGQSDNGDKEHLLPFRGSRHPGGDSQQAVTPAPGDQTPSPDSAGIHMHGRTGMITQVSPPHLTKKRNPTRSHHPSYIQKSKEREAWGKATLSFLFWFFFVGVFPTLMTEELTTLALVHVHSPQAGSSHPKHLCHLGPVPA